jgi:hypothetical protein
MHPGPSLFVLARADWLVGCEWAARPLAPGRAPSRLGPNSSHPRGRDVAVCVCGGHHGVRATVCVAAAGV